MLLHPPPTHQLVGVIVAKVVVDAAVTQRFIGLSSSQQERVGRTVMWGWGTNPLQTTGSTPGALGSGQILDPLSADLVLVLAETDVGAQGEVVEVIQLGVVGRMDVMGRLAGGGSGAGSGQSRVPRSKVLHAGARAAAGTAVPVVENVSETITKTKGLGSKGLIRNLGLAIGLVTSNENNIVPLC